MEDKIILEQTKEIFKNWKNDIFNYIYNNSLTGQNDLKILENCFKLHLQNYFFELSKDLEQDYYTLTKEEIQI